MTKLFSFYNRGNRISGPVVTKPATHKPAKSAKKAPIKLKAPKKPAKAAKPAPVAKKAAAKPVKPAKLSAKEIKAAAQAAKAAELAKKAKPRNTTHSIQIEERAL